MVNIPNQDYLPQLDEKDLLPPISRWTTLGGLFIVGTIGVAITLAAVTKYNVIVKAEATIRPVGELRLVQSAIEGQVKQIFVKENQSVKKGDLIATLDDSSLKTKKNILEIDIKQNQLQSYQINDQIKTLDTQILAEKQRNDHAQALAKAELNQQERNFQDKQIIGIAEVQEAEANFKQSKEELQKALYDFQSALANLRSAEASLRAVETKQNRYQNIANEGALSKEQFEEVQLAFEQGKQVVASQTAILESQKQTIKSLEQSVEAAQARWEKAKTSLNPSQAEVVAAQARLAQEKAARDAVIANLNKEREALIQQRTQIEKQLEKNISELQQLEIDLKQTMIIASTSGIIYQLNIRNPGQSVGSGYEIAQIVPDDASSVIKANVSPQDIGKLEVGQRVLMRVSACPYPEFGTLKGIVSQISSDIIKALEVNNKKFYEVTIIPETLVIGQSKNQCKIKLGMEGRTDIIASEETFLQFILKKARLVTDI